MPIDLRPGFYLPFAATVFGLAILHLLWAWSLISLLLGLSRSRLQVEAAKQAEAGAHELKLGSTILHGQVEHATGENVAVRVDIHQGGSESESSGTWSHQWVESNRTIVVRPFYLRLKSGERVRVEPPPNPDVADDLDDVVWINTTNRIMRAELVVGESVYVRGRLARGSDPESTHSPEGTYRSKMQGWVMQPNGDSMLLSSHSLTQAAKREEATYSGDSSTSS